MSTHEERGRGTHEEGAEDVEGDEVGEGEAGATRLAAVVRLVVTHHVGLVGARHHDLLPRLTRR